MAVEKPFKSTSFNRRQSKSVFISYASEDSEAARRLYRDLKNTGIDPWLDKENILPGQNWDNEIRDAIKSCRYIIILFSSHLVEKISYVQKELKDAILEQQNFPPSLVFIIPARLDSCEIPYRELEKIQYVDLFPNWVEGFERIQKSLKISKTAIGKNDEQMSNLRQKMSNSVSEMESKISPEKSLMPFKGEKQFFVGRTEYINIKIRELLTPSCRISIIGPGGSGKSQLAFKAMRQYYEKNEIIDLVIPVYFADVGLMSIEQFLVKIADGLNVNLQWFEKLDIDGRKQTIYKSLNQRKHPVLYLDNYETVSYILNDQSKEPLQDAIDISDFLNNGLPINTSILLTSREMNNRFGKKEQRIELEGLNDEEATELFVGNVADSDSNLLRNTNNPGIRGAIRNVIEMTGGHPLSIEVISKNISSVDEIDEMAYSLNIKKINRDEPNKRLNSLYASFEYTIEKLDDDLKKLLSKLVLFKSPFPISAAVEILGAKKGDIISLYNRSLLIRITTDDYYGEIEDMEYWLYNFHPATRNYLQDVKGIDSSNLRTEFGQKFYKYYFNLLYDTEHSIGKEKVHRQTFARFNLIFNQDVSINDFSRAIMLAKDDSALWYCANISRSIGLILQTFGTFSKALEYHKKALEINRERNNREAMAGDYGNIGLVYYEISDYPQALEYHKKALEINRERNNREAMAGNYGNIGLVYYDMRDYPQALEYHKKALEINRERNNREAMAGNYGNIGLVYRYLQDYPQALEYHKKALEIHEKELNNRGAMAEDYNNIGIVYRVIKDYPQALEYHKKALEIHEKELNNRGAMAEDYRNTGLVYYDMRDYPQALEYHKKALEINSELNYEMDIAKNHYNLSFPLDKMNKKKEALKHLHIAKTMLLEFEKRTGYLDPLLKDVEDRILYIEQNYQ
jgi:tetratricopeptide (TPR) repeat protein